MILASTISLKVGSRHLPGSSDWSRPSSCSVLHHGDHGAVLVGGDHRQRAVVVADALQPAELAGGEVEAEEPGDAQRAATFGHGESLASANGRISR